MKGRKIFALSIACVMLMLLTPLFAGTMDTTVDADFEQTAAEVVEDMGFGWNLGNSLDSYSGTTFGCQGVSSETCWGNPKTTQTLIDSVKESGVRTIRVPVTWYNHMDPDTYEIDDEWMDRVEEVVGYVLNDDDTYCILNVHHDTGENGWLKANSTDLETKEEIFEKLWAQIAERFSSYGDKLMFEGFNEILDDSENQWYSPSEEAVPIANELNQIFVDTVRASGGNNAQRVLICNTYCAGANTEVTSGFVLPTDTVSDRLIVETHIYQPFYFTSESYPDVTTWDSATLDLYINNIYTQFVQNGIPVIIGEFGCADKGNMEQIISWAKYYVETCTAYGIPCIYWDNGTQYKLYSRTTGTVTEPDLLGTMVAASKGETYEIDTTLYGDVDGDGSITQNDVNVLQKWLLRVSDAQLAEPEAADLYADDLINGFDLCLLRQLLLEEENLCSDVDNWSSWVNTSNGAAAEVTYTDDGVIVDVTSGGIYSWDVQASYRNISLEEGATYQISYDYTATVAQAMDGNVLQNYGDYSVYYNMSLSYTTEKQHYESTFTMDATDKDVQIAFNCGGSGIVPCTIEISNLRLVKVD